MGGGSKIRVIVFWSLHCDPPIQGKFYISDQGFRISGFSVFGPGILNLRGLRLMFRENGGGFMFGCCPFLRQGVANSFAFGLVGAGKYRKKHVVACGVLKTYRRFKGKRWHYPKP